MRLIDTSVVTAGKQYPGLANVSGQSVGNSPITLPGNPTAMQGLDFLQQALLDMVDALSRAMIVDATKPTVISYIPLGGFFAGYTPDQYVYYHGEVFFVPSYYLLAMTGGGGGGAFVANINPNPTDTSPNPQTTMSDGSQVSIHNQRTITVTWSPSGTPGNFPNVSDWKYAQNNFQCFFPTINTVGTGAAATDYHAGWSQNTRLIYYLLGNEVTIQGDAAFTSVGLGLIFYLPNNMWPAYDTYLPIYTSVANTFVYISSSDGRVVYEE